MSDAGDETTLLPLPSSPPSTTRMPVGDVHSTLPSTFPGDFSYNWLDISQEAQASITAMVDGLHATYSTELEEMNRMFEVTQEGFALVHRCLRDELEQRCTLLVDHCADLAALA
eukprot:EG_transcript_46211